MKEQLFKLIKERRKEKNISQSQLANLIKINESTLIRNLKGETQMTLETFIKICEILEIKIHFN